MIDSLVNSDGLRINPDAPLCEPVARGAITVARKRMSVAEREIFIVNGAIRFFSEHGFDAQMRDLAKAIGVTHTLVYHYFPTKQALVDRAYKVVFEGRWKPEWEALLDDRKLAPKDKFLLFYVDYARTVLTREFVRILVFSGLTDRSITDRFFTLLGEKLFYRLIRETRRHRGCRSRARITSREHELLMGLHGGVFYGGMRAFVYGQALPDESAFLDNESFIKDRVRGYLAASLTLEPVGSSIPI